MLPRQHRRGKKRARFCSTMADAVATALNVLARSTFPNQASQLEDFIAEYFGDQAADSDDGMHYEFNQKTVNNDSN